MEIRYHHDSLRIDLYKTLFRQWRWRVKSSNGKTVAASSESFKNRLDCIDNARLTVYGLQNFISHVDNLKEK